jgi:hypothetical protein
MKFIEDIYNSIINKFKKKTNLDIYKGSVMDKYTVSISDALQDVYQEIEDNKNPHIYTKLSGSDIDSMGLLVGCPRRENEDDSSYLYRMVNWNTSHQCGNTTAIETALMNLSYASIAKYVPYTQGVATATVYVIPKSLDDNTIKLAINEVEDRLKDVVSSTTYINIIIPDILKITVNCYLSVYKDLENVKNNIAEKFKDYINNIPTGDYLEVGQLNKIGTNESNVNYFSISTVLINEEELYDLKVIQTIDKKFVFDNIIWNIVEE